MNSIDSIKIYCSGNGVSRILKRRRNKEANKQKRKCLLIVCFNFDFLINKKLNRLDFSKNFRPFFTRNLHTI